MPVDTKPQPELGHGAVLKRFIALNQLRLRRTREALRPRQRDFLDLLPLLFHINHPMLPGYTSKECPAGIPNYEPDKPALEAANRLGRTFRYGRYMHRNLPVLAIYIMGSPGTVAYSEDSDFDVWICHDPALEPDAIAQLGEKANQIAAWAASLDLEVHFFLVHPDQFRKGEVDALSSESSGTAQRLLLLDEFYRTALCLAGQYPFWWLVPPDQEVDYDGCVAEMRRQRFPHARDLIDFGGLGHIPAEEFLGAAVWQLYKGIDSPYKSVLKLLLIEAYAREYPYLDLLSLRFKRSVYEGEGAVDRLDPYLMMLDKVEDYLTGRAEQERLQLARRCFYFKVNERLSGVDPGLAPWRRELLQGRVDRWGWSRPELYLLDSRTHWRVERVMEERRILFDALSESYRFLSAFARRYSAALISQQDLNVLGRKLYGAFERKPGKVELLNRGMVARLVEPQLSVHELQDDGEQSVWLLHRGLVRPEEGGHTPIKRFRFVTELVAWVYFNQVADRATQFVVYTRQSRLNASELKAMIARMHSLFPERAANFGTVQDFGQAAQLVQTALFANVGLDPFARGELGVEGRIASSRSDALSYGGLAENLVLTVDQVVVTSWQEVLTFHYRGGQGLMDCLCHHLKWSPPGQGRPPVQPSVAGYNAAQGPLVARRLEELFRAVTDGFYNHPQGTASRYVLQVGLGYYALHFQEGVPHYQALDNHAGLLRYLGAPQRCFSPVVFDPYLQADRILPLIYSHNRPGVVQMFYRVQSGQVDIYVLDERGSLFHRRAPYYDTDALVGQYSYFFEAVLNRVNFLMQEGQSLQGPEGLEFHAIEQEPSGALRLQRQQPRFASGSFHNLQVMVDKDDTGRTSFTFYCDGREFTSPESGGRAFEDVIRYVLELRRSGQTYPVFITDISMSAAVLGEETVSRIQTVNFLTYKYRIEEKLNQTMTQLMAGGA